jgi:PPM family protein phosphatase
VYNVITMLRRGQKAPQSGELAHPDQYTYIQGIISLPLNRGPIELKLGESVLTVGTIWDTLPHDVAEAFNPSLGCVIVAPEQVDLEQKRGYKGLRDGETVELGRSSDDSPFTFSSETSRQHAQLRREGQLLIIADHNSTNGTAYRYANKTTPATLRNTGATATRRVARVEAAREPLPQITFTAAAESIASPSHPERNEDASFISEAANAIGVFDGVRSKRGSELAAQTAATTIAGRLERTDNVMPIPLSEHAMRDALLEAHYAIRNSAKGAEILTTATVAKIFQSASGTPYAAVASTGDCRAYLFRDNALQHVTLDHAYAAGSTSERRDIQKTFAQATDLSKLSERELHLWKKRNIISTALGQDGEPTISVSTFEIQPGDRILVTSDGVHDNLTDGEITSALTEQTDDTESVYTLVHAAHERSLADHMRAKRDDITAAIMTCPHY